MHKAWCTVNEDGIEIKRNENAKRERMKQQQTVK